MERKRMRHQIYKAINEGINKALIDFDQNSDKLSKSHQKNSTICLIDMLYEAIVKYDIFKVENYETKITAYIDGNDTIIMKENCTDNIGFSLQLKGNKATLNIFKIYGSFIQNLYRWNMIIIKYIQEFSRLKELSFANDLILNTIVYEDYIQGGNTTALTFDIDELTKCNRKDFPNDIRYAVSAEKTNLDLVEIDKSSLVKKDSIAVVLSSEDYSENPKINYKGYVQYFNSIGYHQVYISPISKKTFQDDLYYIYDHDGNLKWKALKYGFEFNENVVININNMLGNIKKTIKTIGAHFERNTKELTRYAEKRSQAANIEIYDDKIYKKVISIIEEFAIIMAVKRIPFYKESLQNAIINNKINTYLELPNYNYLNIGTTIAPLFQLSYCLGYNNAQLIDMIDTACRYLQKYGNVNYLFGA